MATLKKFYVCTAIPYVNAKPHIGHAMDYLYADVLARYHRQHGGTEVAFSAGTDEHGSKIAEKAAENKLTPQVFADQNVKVFQDFLKKLCISYDRFVRTTDKGHEQRSQAIWEKLKPYIAKGKYVGWYCVGCEEYVTDTVAQANKGVCPAHNRPYEKLEEDNYFFKLSQFTPKITEAIESGKFRIVPASRRLEILNVLKEGLEDISVSRPKEKISWGIPVPGDNTQVMYVWFEALMNYITVIGYPEHKDFATFWPADVQVIGKDILRFHAAVWPAMLLGLGVALPKVLFVHGHVLSGGQKMSKSIGNVIDPLEVIDRHGVDAFRYYFLRHIPSQDDGDFTWERFETAYNSELANDLGNAVQRVAAMVHKYQDGIVGDVPEGEHDQHEYHQAVEDFRFDRALEQVWEQIRGLNQYIDTEQPWKVAKEDAKHLRDILAYCVSDILEIAELLRPFMPDTADKIGLVFKDGLVRATEGTLFPKLETKTEQQPQGK